MAHVSFPTITSTYNDPQVWSFQVSAAIGQLQQGKSNNTGEMTLTENSATTVITLPQGRLGFETVILLMPTSANAAAEYAAGTLYASSRDIKARTLTFTHVNNAQTDRTFKYVLVG